VTARAAIGPRAQAIGICLLIAAWLTAWVTAWMTAGHTSLADSLDDSRTHQLG
tara:strand:- start:2131 stop:2289 length:159 start_codon:yes stop_codon:yes gene_type:complete